MQSFVHGLVRRALSLGTLLVVTVWALIIGGCNTIAGMGEDVSAAGQSVADWASPEDK